jgi:hypothetical protein
MVLLNSNGSYDGLATWLLERLLPKSLPVSRREPRVVLPGKREEVWRLGGVKDPLSLSDLDVWSLWVSVLLFFVCVNGHGVLGVMVMPKGCPITIDFSVSDGCHVV